MRTWATRTSAVAALVALSFAVVGLDSLTEHRAAASESRGNARASAKVTATASASAVATASPAASTAPSTAAAAGGKPNIVLVLTDDLSMDLVPTMRGVREMQRRGASYPHSFVVDSLCCVSRTSLLTGQYPHQTGVLANASDTRGANGPLGGFPAYAANGNAERSFNLNLQKAGYATGFVGKFLNEYEYIPGVKPVPPIQPGWDRFNPVFGSAYDGWGFDMLTGDGPSPTVKSYPTPPSGATEAEKDALYVGQVISDNALDFIKSNEGTGRPYFLEVAPYAPHSRVNPEGAWPGEPLFPPAFGDRANALHAGNCGPIECKALGTSALPGFGTKWADNRPVTKAGKPARDWNKPLSRRPASQYVDNLRTRAQMAQSADRMLRQILASVGPNTYVIFTSDNGFHLGQSGLGRGKGTAYNTDISVPLVVVGPGVTPGARQQVAMNIDLAPTFEELAGAQTPAYRSGTSLVASLRDPASVTTNYAFVEHTAWRYGKDPDLPFTGDELMRIPSYVAVRSRDGVLIRYDLNTLPAVTETGYEYYSYAKRDWEKKNQFTDPREKAAVKVLLGKLKQWDGCQGIVGNAAVTPACRALTQ